MISALKQLAIGAILEYLHCPRSFISGLDAKEGLCMQERKFEILRCTHLNILIVVSLPLIRYIILKLGSRIRYTSFKSFRSSSFCDRTLGSFEHCIIICVY